MRTFLLATVIGWVGLVPRIAALAQTPVGSNSDLGTPRVLTDSVFATRLAVEQLADMIRRGAPTRGLSIDGRLLTLMQAFAASAAKRTRGSPRADAGPAWDFFFEPSDILAMNPHEMHVTAYGRLATDTSRGTPLQLVFAREGRTWKLQSYSGLLERLAELTQVAERDVR